MSKVTQHQDEVNVIDGMRIMKRTVPLLEDLSLARQFGYEAKYEIRKLIARYLGENGLGEVFVTATKTSERGGRPGKTFWLDEAQALFVAAKSETPIAVAILRHIISIFLKARRGEISSANPTSARNVDALIAADPLPVRASVLEVARGVFPESVIRAILRLPFEHWNSNDWIEALNNYTRMHRSLHGEGKRLDLVVGGAS